MERSVVLELPLRLVVIDPVRVAMGRLAIAGLVLSISAVSSPSIEVGVEKLPWGFNRSSSLSLCLNASRSRVRCFMFRPAKTISTRDR